jgi:hypothetical protein
MQRAFRVFEGIQRQRRMMFREPMAVREIRFLLLKPRAVAQHDFAERSRPWRAVHGATKAIAHEQWQIAAVIDMCVGQYHGFDRIRRDGERHPVSHPKILDALKKPAVDENPHAGFFQQILRAGHGFARTEKGQLHRSSADRCMFTSSIASDVAVMPLIQVINGSLTWLD